MRIVAAAWKPDTNRLLIECGCGNHIIHRSDKWRVDCELCGRTENLGSIRRTYVEEQEKARRISRSAPGHDS